MFSCTQNYSVRMQAVARAAAIPLEALPVEYFETSSIIWSRSAKTKSESRLLYLQDLSFSSITVMVIMFGLSLFFCKAAGFWMLKLHRCFTSTISRIKSPRHVRVLGKILQSCSSTRRKVATAMCTYTSLRQSKRTARAQNVYCVVSQPG